MTKLALLLLPIFLLALDQNISIKKTSKDINKTNTTKKKLIQKHLKEQMKKEAKYAKEKMFYMGKDYNLTEHEVDPNSLKHIKTIEPEYDFDMDDVYN